jgi:hypothetical protein
MNTVELIYSYNYLNEFTRLILNLFYKNTNELQDKIIGNFIARGNASMKGITILIENKNISDCYMLYRCILERMFYLRYLKNNNCYKEFDDWSFKVQYEMNNNLFSDKDMKIKPEIEDCKPTIEENKRYNELRNMNSWKRPKMKDIAREMDLMFLYKFGYHHASSFVHPMANDGQIECAIQANINIDDRLFVGVYNLINNSLLICSLLIREGMNNSSLKWHDILFDFLDDYKNYMKCGNNKYINTISEIFTILKINNKLCEKSHS